MSHESNATTHAGRVGRAQARVVSWNVDKATDAELLVAALLLDTGDTIDALCLASVRRELRVRAGLDADGAER